MGRLLIWLSGAAPKILRRCPTERPKYIGIGAAIAITAVIASVSMTFALHMDLTVSLSIAIIFAAAWGLSIMSLDRWLIVSLQRQSESWRYLILVIPRLVLALLFGFVISTPFILQIFRPEINQEIAVIHDQRASSYFAQLANDPLSRKIASDRATVANLNQTIASGGGTGENPYSNPVLHGLLQQLNQDTSQADRYFQQWQCQLYGVPAESCHVGNGPLAVASRARYLKATAAVNRDRLEVQSLQNKLLSSSSAAHATAVADAKSNLPGAKRALQQDLAEQRALTTSFDVSNANDTGLLIRLQALDSFAQSSTTLNSARWLLFILFTIIEVLPILVKVLLNLGPENTYEKMLALEETMLLRAAREDALRRQTARSLE